MTSCVRLSNNAVEKWEPTCIEPLICSFRVSLSRYEFPPPLESLLLLFQKAL